ncbi:hypothetical protein ACRN9O_02815 [Shewanella oncorhynchi]|uniref:hypothetical protein n=1 Tax=Shewanella oncorhynchi TaxID=2726434 RepID=UPI003D7B6A7C
MVIEEEVGKLIDTELYSSLLVYAKKNSKVNVNECDLPKVLLAYDAQKINAAEFSILEMEKIVSSNMPLFTLFFDKKIDTFIDTPDEQESNDDVIATLPFYKNFLVIYIIEFCLLIEKQDELERYLKKIRVPGSKKYSRELKEIMTAL